MSISEVPFGAAGEMGIVSRGTGSELFKFADAGGASSEVDMFAEMQVMSWLRGEEGSDAED